MADAIFWQLAQSEVRLFITTDKGFTQYRDGPHHGLRIVNLEHPNRRKIHTRVFHA